jgi:hypothetical protein
MSRGPQRLDGVEHLTSQAARHWRDVEYYGDDGCGFARPDTDVVQAEPQRLIAAEHGGVVAPHVVEHAVAGVASLAVKFDNQASAGISIVGDSKAAAA